MRSDRALVLDMLLAAEKMMRFVGDIDEQTFLSNELIQSAVVREFQVLGEAARLISEGFKHEHSDINWHVIAGMRNRLVHEYFDLNLTVIWDTVRQDIPPLISQLQRLASGDSDT